MIQANELRIGNWVNLCFNEREGWFKARVTEILRDNRINTDTEFGDGGEYYYEAIPLTSEVLEKCGFKKVDGLDLKYGSDIYDITIMASAKRSLRLASYRPPLWFGMIVENSAMMGSIGMHANLHELQNLHFSITGKELNYQP